jgi:FkbM family methyltransferase
MLDADIDRRLERALAVDVEECKSVEHRYLEGELAPNWRSFVLIFGASQLGLRVLSGLRRLGIEPLAFVDNHSAKWGRSIGGLPILSLAESMARFGTSASYIVCIWRSKPVMEQIAGAGCRSAAHFKALFWHYPQEFLPNMRVNLPHLILAQGDAVRAALAALHDNASKVEFVTQIEWLLNYEFGSLDIVDNGEQYFAEGLFTSHEREVFVDCGAYTGDTLQAFLEHDPNPQALHPFEPEPTNLRALKEWCNRQPKELRDRVFIHPYATSDRRQRLRFQVDGVGSAVDEHGGIEVEAVTLDEVLHGEPVTFIKMDIEGAEPDAIAGAAGLIADRRPVLAICLYHRQEHLFTIPNKLRELVADYRLFIRRYGDQFGDIVCYAVPPERAPHGEADV